MKYNVMKWPVKLIKKGDDLELFVKAIYIKLEFFNLAQRHAIDRISPTSLALLMGRGCAKWGHRFLEPLVLRHATKHIDMSLEGLNGTSQ